MAKTGFKMKGWKKMSHVLKEAFGSPLKKHVAKATRNNAHYVQAQIRKGLQRGRFRRNAPLTVAIKGHGKPLNETGAQLFPAISTDVKSWKKALVGVFATSGVYNIALTIHDGATIAVTQKMRGLFFLLWQASIGGIDPGELTGRAAELWRKMPGGWKPLRKNTTHIKIPPRPFVKRVFNDKRVQQRVKNVWAKAVKAAIKETSR